MTLREKQSLFVRLSGLLIEWAYQQGYELTYGEAWRPSVTADIYRQQGKGISNSNHLRRLAVDFNLFRAGRWLTSTEDHEPLGAYWESLHELCRWGGRFGDGNHYSLEHEGVK